MTRSRGKGRKLTHPQQQRRQTRLRLEVFILFYFINTSELQLGFCLLKPCTGAVLPPEPTTSAPPGEEQVGGKPGQPASSFALIPGSTRGGVRSARSKQGVLLGRGQARMGNHSAPLKPKLCEPHCSLPARAHLAGLHVSLFGGRGDQGSGPSHEEREEEEPNRGSGAAAACTQVMGLGARLASVSMELGLWGRTMAHVVHRHHSCRATSKAPPQAGGRLGAGRQAVLGEAAVLQLPHTEPRGAAHDVWQQRPERMVGGLQPSPATASG